MVVHRQVIQNRGLDVVMAPATPQSLTRFRDAASWPHRQF